MNAPDINLPDSPDTASFHSSWFLKAVHFNVKREVDISMHLSGGDIFSADVLATVQKLQRVRFCLITVHLQNRLGLPF